MRDQSIVTSPRRQPIADGPADFLKLTFPDCAERRNNEKELTSIAIGRRELRKKILSSESFRRSFRKLPLEVQDIYVKRGWLFWGQGGLGECMSARVYVSDVKTFGQARGAMFGKSLSESLRGTVERFESLAFWAQTTVIVGTMGAILGTLGLLARAAHRTMQSYSESLEAASSSEEGLDRAIRARSGRAGEAQETAASARRAQRGSQGAPQPPETTGEPDGKP